MRLGAILRQARRWEFILAAALMWVALPNWASAQAGAGKDKLGLPAMTIAPADDSATPVAPVPPMHHRAAQPAANHRVFASKAMQSPVKSVPVEAAEARLLLKENTWVYAEPSNRSARVEPGVKGKFVNVTGSTHFFLRVRLKDGQEGYVLADTVQLTTPSDKLFMLTHDAPVLDAPNHWGRKVAEVHHGHAVHVVGIALNYMRIRMKSGVEGYIASPALE
jgi:hypothetical protein